MALSLVSATPVFTQQPQAPCTEVEYFQETGHRVCDRFLEFFNARGGVEIFGYPLTEQIVENDRVVQYFQRVRMEYHPENPPRYQVQLGLLGDFFAPPEHKGRIPPSKKPKSNDRERRYFPETGHTVGFSFLKFYKEKGGLDIFGYPVTEFILENGRFVQYFQRALMEWDPNQGGIVLHNLGEMWVDCHPNLREHLAPLIQSLEITELVATASVRDAFTGREGKQFVWVYVYDQSGEPVSGAQVKLVVHYSEGDSTYSMFPTDEQGHTQTSFDLKSPASGYLVIIDAFVSYAGVTTEAQTSFFPWW